MRQVTASILTDSGGAAVATGAASGAGALDGVYVRIGTLEATTDIVITDVLNDRVLLTLTNLVASGFYSPRLIACDEDGVALDPVTYEKFPTSGRLRATVAGGGNAKSGSVYFYLD